MEAAMNEVADHFDFVVRWEPYLLRPDTPAEGRPLPPAYTDPSSPSAMQLREAGAAVGAEFTFKARTVPNTLAAHALLEFAKSWQGGSQQSDIAEKLFQLRFREGSMLGEGELLAVAAEQGLPGPEVQEYIRSPGTLEAVRSKAQQWNLKGINGVPFFYMNGKRMFSGAQEKEVFKRMFGIAAEKFPLQAGSKS